MILLLFPWMPVAVWSIVFLSDPITEYSAVPLLFGKVIPFFVLIYPVFLVHGMASSWLAMRRGKAAGLILMKALYPLLFIIPVLMLTVAFVKQ
jgi:hypothetical protein